MVKPNDWYVVYNENGGWEIGYKEPLEVIPISDETRELFDSWRCLDLAIIDAFRIR